MTARAVDLSSYADGLRQRARAHEQRIAERNSQLCAALPSAVQRLVRDFGVSRVVLFGSLARGEAHLESDVDLLVEGIAPSKLFEAAAMLSSQLQADVDLVPAEAARPLVLERAAAEGRVLHG
jgi:predicted nucleotidyltransferase